jgi:hypothetical protein
MRMLLKTECQSIELSHFHYLLSAYQPVKEELERLRRDVIAALEKAAATRQTQYVDHDVVDFVLACHPTGSLTLFSAFKHFDKAEIE